MSPEAKPVFYDRREQYEKYMKPVAKDIVDLCYNAGIPVLLLSAVANDEEKTEYESMFLSPKTLGIELYNDIFREDRDWLNHVNRPMANFPSDYNRKSAVGDESNGFEKAVRAKSKDYTDPEYKAPDQPIILPYIDSFVRRGFMYSIPCICLIAPYNYGGETLYRGRQRVAYSMHYQLTDDRFMAYGFRINRYDPYRKEEISLT